MISRSIFLGEVGRFTHLCGVSAQEVSGSNPYRGRAVAPVQPGSNIYAYCRIPT
ncbi:hypothetical protein HanIR_Chr12g0606231 [Helianthus annuus]|nr:hypothetical protein HanIR_Chr12g0606231 [Helianthus annuus]